MLPPDSSLLLPVHSLLQLLALLATVAELERLAAQYHSSLYPTPMYLIVDVEP